MAAITELPGTTATAADSAPSTGDAAAGKEKKDNWQFIEPQPIREDQVDNAVKFLSHPKVRGSPVVYRRSFLERKGLSREEIDEAFRRVPDPPSDSSPSTVPAAGPVGTVNPPTQGVQIAQPVAQVNSGQRAPKSTSWTQMLLALGVLTAAGAGAGVFTQKYFIPKLKQWIRDIVSGKSSNGEQSKTSRPDPAHEAAAAASAQVAAFLQEFEKSKSEERKSRDNIVKALEAQTQELKSALAGMKDVVQNVEVTKYQRPVTNNFQSNGSSMDEYLKGQPNGGRPTSVSENVSVTTKRTSFGMAPDSFARTYNDGQQVNAGSSSSTNGVVHAPHSQSYLDVMAMLERGEKPPGIREINDKPPNPNQQPSIPRLQPRLKPWEKTALESQANNPGTGSQTGQSGRYNETWNVGSSSAVNTELTIGSGTSSSSEPWWRKKSDTDAGPSSSAVKITEVDLSTEVDIGTVQVGQSSSSSSLTQNTGGRTGWVPPAVPMPVYPGAEEAIRRPKPQAGAIPVRTPSSAKSMPAASASGALQRDESLGMPTAQAEVLDSSVQSSTELPEQRVELPDEQEPEYLDRSLVDSTRTFRDVLEEDGRDQ